MGAAVRLETGVDGWLGTGAVDRLETGAAGRLETGAAGRLETGAADQLETGAADRLETGAAGWMETGAVGWMETGAAGWMETGAVGWMETGTVDWLETGAIGWLETGPTEPEPVTYSILETGSYRGKRLLMSSDGDGFGIRSYNGGDTIRWRCNMPSCKAHVIQKGDTFNLQQHNHNHTPDPKLKLKRDMITEAKVRAVDNIDQSAESIAEEVCSKVPKEVVNAAKASDLVMIVKNTRRPAAPVPSQPVAPVSSQCTAPESKRPAAPVSSRPPDLPTEKHPKDPATYEILEKGSAHGKPFLLSSDGYDFHLLRCNDFAKRWVCNNRFCPAAINQRGDSFQRGQREHTHPPQSYIRLKPQMVAEAKEMALSDINKSADSIAKEICSKVPKCLNAVPNLRNIVYATRSGIIGKQGVKT